MIFAVFLRVFYAYFRLCYVDRKGKKVPAGTIIGENTYEIA